MTRPEDTSEEAHELHRRLLMSRSGEERLRMALDLFDTAKAIVLAGLGEIPGEDEVSRKLRLVRRLYPELDAETLAGLERWLRRGPPVRP